MKRGGFILLMFFVACEPHFQSGKTQCSDNGTCPSGFVCSDDGSGRAYTCVTMPSACAGQVGFYCVTTDTCWQFAVACSTVVNCGTTAAPDYQVCVQAGNPPRLQRNKCAAPIPAGSGGGTGGTAGTGGMSGTGGSVPTRPIRSTALLRGNCNGRLLGSGDGVLHHHELWNERSAGRASVRHRWLLPDCNGTKCLPISGGSDGGTAFSDGGLGRA